MAADIAAVERMCLAQTHRGPDGCGLYHDARVALGHRRLSIIDLSLAGKQPMSNEDGSLWVTFNGEIYNHRELRSELASLGHHFSSNSDTEVLVHGLEQWGIDDLLLRLRGMFAFALYDTKSGDCVLARDRFGIKPLYYVECPDGSVAFASEVKALTSSNLVTRELDRNGVAGFLLFGSVPSPDTFIRNVKCLLPGHLLWLRRRGLEHRHWDMPQKSSTQSAQSPEELSSLLADSVARHLISDVPTGVFLSGGVDSAGLVSLAYPLVDRLKTLTVIFDEKEFSEATLARDVANRFATDHTEIRLTAADFLNEIPKILAAMDQPTNDGVNTYFVSRAARQAGVTVVLSGLGGDEVFWGYGHYRWLTAKLDPLKTFNRLPHAVRNLSLATAAALGRWRGKEPWARLSFLQEKASCERTYLAVRGFFPPLQIARLLDIDTKELNEIIERQVASRPVPRPSSSADAFSYLETRGYLHDQLLRDTDVFSMAHSIEVRVPYLDHLVVEYARNSLPSLKRAGKVTKPLLVSALNDPLITSLAVRAKRGFTFPFAKWMREHSKALAESAVGDTPLNRATVRGLWDSFDRGRLHWSRAWATIVLGARP